MKLLLEGTGREVRLVAPDITSKSRGTIWQGETIDGIPVLVVAVVVSPLIAADDPRQDQFERSLNRVLDPALLHPEVELLPEELAL